MLDLLLTLYCAIALGRLLTSEEENSVRLVVGVVGWPVLAGVRLWRDGWRLVKGEAGIK